jgi:hypothetical protein
VLVACAWWSLHTMTASHHGEMGGLNLPNYRQFNWFSKMLLRFWSFCLIGPNGSLWKDRRMSKSVADFDDVQVDTEGMRTIEACV